MQVIVSSRNVEISDELRMRIDEQFERLTRYEPAVSRAEITLWEDGPARKVDAVLSIDRRPRMHGEAEADAFRTALDRLHEKLARRLRREHEKRRDHRAPPLEELLDEDAEG